MICVGPQLAVICMAGLAGRRAVNCLAGPLAFGLGVGCGLTADGGHLPSQITASLPYKSLRASAAPYSGGKRCEWQLFILHCFVLRCTPQCAVVYYCSVLLCAVYTVPCPQCAVLYWPVSYYVRSVLVCTAVVGSHCCVLRCFALHCTVVNYVVLCAHAVCWFVLLVLDCLYCCVLYWTVYWFVLLWSYGFVLYCTVLCPQCAALYCFVLLECFVRCTQCAVVYRLCCSVQLDWFVPCVH